VNLVGSFFCAQKFAQQMANRGRGSIVGIASIAARMPRFKQAAYAASKAGMRQSYRVLGLELAPLGVRVNTVSPGPTDTEMMRRMAKDHPSVDDLAAGSPEAFRPPIPRGVVGRPHEIAAAVRFLLSPEASHITLTDLVVDGGELLGM
jgi:2,3-dihydro-2,3-dihydroxybenzoate dehydrogenase